MHSSLYHSICSAPEEKENKSSRASSSKEKGSGSGGKKHAEVESLEYARLGEGVVDHNGPESTGTQSYFAAFHVCHVCSMTSTSRSV